MNTITDSRINELLTFATNKLALDVSTCSEMSLKKIPMILKVARVQRAIQFTDDELRAVQAELGWVK